MPHAALAAPPSPSREGDARPEQPRRLATVSIPEEEWRALSRAAASLEMPLGSLLLSLARVGGKTVRESAAWLRQRDPAVTDEQIGRFATVLEHEWFPRERHEVRS